MLAAFATFFLIGLPACSRFFFLRRIAHIDMDSFFCRSDRTPNAASLSDGWALYTPTKKKCSRHLTRNSTKKHQETDEFDEEDAVE
jgi:hypothetical protein